MGDHHFENDRQENNIKAFVNVRKNKSISRKDVWSLFELSFQLNLKQRREWGWGRVKGRYLVQWIVIRLSAEKQNHYKH